MKGWKRLAATLGVLSLAMATGSLQAYASDDPPLHAVEVVESNPTNRMATYLAIQFDKDEAFQFLVERSLVDEEGNRGQGFLWDHDQDTDTDPVRLGVPSGVLEVRAALLAARAFWDGVCNKAGLQQRFVGRGPMKIWIPDELANGRADAISRFSINQILFHKDYLDAETAAHEYFHMVQGAIWTGGDSTLWERKYEQGAWGFLSEVTATWAQDVPIVVDRPNGTRVDLDAENSYLSPVGQFWRLSDFSLFQRGHSPGDPKGMSGYIEALITKYFSEQCAGGADPGDHAAVLRWFARAMKAELTISRLIKLMAEQLPATFGSSWQERWGRFHASFRMANVVQKAGAAPDHPKSLGYHDDAFQTLTGKPTRYPLGAEGDMYPVYIGKQGLLRGGYHRTPRTLHLEPAANDEQRVARLRETLATETIAPQGCRTRLIEFERAYPNTEPFERVAFVLVEGGAPSGAYLLEQRTRDPDYRARRSATFRWDKSLQLGEHAPWSLARVALVPEAGERAYLWCGLLNNAPDAMPTDVQWTYVNLPRLVSYARPAEPGRATASIQLVEGNALERDVAEGYRNGDRFVLEFHTTEAVHFGDAPRKHIPPREAMLELHLLGPGDTAVKLDDPLRIDAYIHEDDASMDSGGRIRYRISGRIAQDNPVRGPCRFRCRLTSLFKLGAGDEQEDDSFTFRITDGPRVSRVRITSADEVAYDSGVSRRGPGIRSEGGAFKLGIEVTFDTDMNAARVRVSAGGSSPFKTHAVGDLVWEGPRKCRGTLQFSKSQAPKHGTLTLAIAGADRRGGLLDADVYRDGSQPDTNHLVRLDTSELYRLALTFNLEHARENAQLHAGPLRLEYALEPSRLVVHRHNLVSVNAEGILKGVREQLGVVREHSARIKQTLEAVLQDPRRRPIGELAAARAIFEAQRTTIAALRAGGKPDFPRLYRAELLGLERDISLLEVEDSHAGLVAVLKRRLKRYANERSLLESEEQTLLAVGRVFGARRAFTAKKKGLVSAHFRGAVRKGAATADPNDPGSYEAQAPPWEPHGGGESTFRGFESLDLYVLLAEWSDLQQLQHAVGATAPSPLSYGLPVMVADGIWSFFPFHARPAFSELQAKPHLPALTSNYLLHLVASGRGFALSLPATGVRTLPTSDGVEQTTVEGPFRLSWLVGPRAAFMGESFAWWDPFLIDAVKEATTAKGGLPFFGSEDGSLKIYAHPTAFSDGGHTRVVVATASLPGAPSDHAHARVAWSWTWRLEHVGDQSGLQPTAVR